MPLLAVLAVALCVAVELIVWSVMGGFLKTLVGTGRSVMGDVAIMWPNSGFAHADDLIERLEADPELDAAAPLIETFGLLSLPDRRHETVVVRGVDPARFDAVTGFAGTLWWKPIDEPPPKDEEGEDWRYYPPAPLITALREAGFGEGEAVRLAKDPERALAAARSRAGVSAGVIDVIAEEVESKRRHVAFWNRLLDDGRRLSEAEGEARTPAVALGIEVSGFNIRKPGGWFMPGGRVAQRSDGDTEFVGVFLPRDEVTMTVMPLDEQARGVDVVARRFPVANEFRTGFYEADNRVVLMPLEALRSMLKMGGGVRIDPDASPFGVRRDEATGQASFAEAPILGVRHARVTNVVVRASEGVDEARAQERCRAVYEAFALDHAGEVPAADAIIIRTWREQNATFIAAVEKEIALVMVIFAVISLTVVFLVLSIFWAMVNERTRDVGVLRALGASRAGIAWLWLRYGLVIGGVGSALGLGMAAAVVWNINPIHEWMGGALGISVWDPRIYHFARIPSEIEPVRAVIIGVSGVVASVLGAWWPAWRAARMDPVKALRFE